MDLNQFMQNPLLYLRQAGYQIPDNMRNPQEIFNHLIQSGQIKNPRFQFLQQFLRR